MDAIAGWDRLLRPDVELTPSFTAGLAEEMRRRGLTFGGRITCPFLRPFFLTGEDEARMRAAAERLADLAERVAAAALESPDLFGQLGLTDAEAALVRIEPGYDRASTASRLDAFLLPGTIGFAEYNAESPAGPAYTERLCEVFDGLDAMARFRAERPVRFNRTIAPLLEALLASYREWGGTARPPVVAIVDWREVPTRTEFEILASAFAAQGVPALVCDPRDLVFDGRSLAAGGRRIDLVYRRVLISDILARPDACAPLVEAYRARAVCVANTFRCKLAHKKAFFAVLTDERNGALFTDGDRDVIRAHVPWTRVLADTAISYAGSRTGLIRLAEDRRDRLVLKPNDEYGGTGVHLGWEMDPSAWKGALDRALADAPGTWVVQERIPVRREVFPRFDEAGRVAWENMLVDFAPYLFRGRMAGYLTRLSATGLANVTSGGGQVPAFVIGA